MSVLIKNLVMGEGMTKICVPIIGVDKENILQEAEELKDSVADIIEWRADYFDDVMDKEQVLQVLEQLTDVLGDKPVLFTFRTQNEGGEKYIDSLYYKMLLKSVIKQGKAGAVDVELFMGDNLLEDISDTAKESSVRVIASSHDFDKTPEKEELVKRLIAMKDKGADISKLAVMPKSTEDVLTLLQATDEVHRTRPDITLITMSMGQTGVISRLGGGIFGSAMTFGAKTKALASAPGQVEMNELKSILNTIEG